MYFARFVAGLAGLVALQVGILDIGVDLPETATEEEIVAAVKTANEDPRVHGILVQVRISSTRAGGDAAPCRNAALQRLILLPARACLATRLAAAPPRAH